MKPCPWALMVTILPSTPLNCAFPAKVRREGVKSVWSEALDQAIEFAESQNPSLPLAWKMPICPAILRKVGVKEVKVRVGV